MSLSISKKSFSRFSILTAGILWGCMGLFTTPLTQSGIDGISIVAVRSVLTAILLGIFILIINPKLFKIKLSDLWMFMGMGIVSFSFFNICYLNSIKLNNSLGTACTLMYTAPIFIMLLSRLLFKEKFTKAKIICLALATLGCAFISGGGNITYIGFLFGLCSGLGYGLYSIFSIYALRKYSFFTSVFYAFAFSALSLIPFCNIEKIIFASKNNFYIPLLFLGLSVLITVLPYIIYTFGLKDIPPSEASIIACIEPLVAAIVGAIAYNQVPDITEFFGMLMVLLAVILLSKTTSNKP